VTHNPYMLRWMETHPGIHQSKDICKNVNVATGPGNAQVRELFRMYPEYITRVGDGVYQIKFPRKVEDDTDSIDMGFAQGVTIIVEIVTIRSDKNGEALVDVIANGEVGWLHPRTQQGEELRSDDIVEGRILSRPKFRKGYTNMLLKISKTVYQLSIEGELED
jgi:hypothetical protein